MIAYQKCEVCDGKGAYVPPYGPRGQNGYDYDVEHDCGACGGTGQIEIEVISEAERFADAHAEARYLEQE